MSSKLDLLAANLAAYIEAAPELIAHDSMPALEALTEQKGNINTTVQSALAKLGVSIVVIVSDSDFGPGGDAKRLNEARLVVEIGEIYATNKSGRRCLEVAEAVARSAQGKSNGLGLVLGRERTFQLEPGPNLRLVPHATQTIRHVTFLTQYML